MKIARILLAAVSLSIPATNVAKPHYYAPKPQAPQITYCNAKYCHCPYCDPYSNSHNYPYYPESSYYCPECDNTPATIFIIWALIAAAVYLVDSSIQS